MPSTTPLVTVGQFKEWYRPGGEEIATASDLLLERLSIAATNWLELWLDRAVVQAAYDLYFDGTDRVGRYLQDGWAAGKQNIRVQWTGGWTAGQEPAEIVQACLEVMAYMFREGPSVGRSSASLLGQSESYLRELSPLTRQALEGHRRLGRTHGRAGHYLYLPHFPIVGTPTVTEDGQALTVGVGSSGGYDVLMEAEEGRLYRKRDLTVPAWLG